MTTTFDPNVNRHRDRGGRFTNPRRRRGSPGNPPPQPPQLSNKDLATLQRLLRDYTQGYLREKIILRAAHNIAKHHSKRGKDHLLEWTVFFLFLAALFVAYATPFNAPATTAATIAPATASASSVEPAVADESPSPESQRQLASKIVSYLTAKGWRFSQQAGEVTIVYLEGKNADGSDNDNAPDQFNDRRVVLTFKDGQPTIGGNWVATISPGDYYIKNKMNPKGTAFVRPGEYREGWTIGTHQGASSAPQEALVQAAPITVYRDNISADTGDFGINQHGGWDAPLNQVGNTSAGCLVGRTVEGHQEFMQMVKSDRRAQNSAFRFDTLIIPKGGF
ncbi:hypothetical protein H6F43_03670 [Leptolyngbya sp. FACHB-36]|uniref:hypothetical protein n=1 Tax=Leptolyngbya sp. FACHB-36 TaxID=2692808 RepID=UPI001680C6B4|nr:hypothetical protein [Leptolyngbya sp. FACHB-36]MBD2019280.1 hypothetical protein [Leptolyngbya sp. FACHB-36]